MCVRDCVGVCIDVWHIQGDLVKAETFTGLATSIDQWNSDGWKAVEGSTGAAATNPFIMLDVNALSDQITRLIRKDYVHFDAPLYGLTLSLDLNIVFGGVSVCNEPW